MLREELPQVSGGWSRPWRHQGWPHREDTRGGGYQLDPVGVGRRRGRAGRAGHISMVQVRTKCELGVSIGNSAFTFLLHFYFKHRKRERKQIEKKCARKKKRKKKIKLLSFLIWQHAPFSFLSSSWFPNPERSISSAPAPKSLPLGRVSGRQSQGGEDTRGQRPRETWGGCVQTGRWT